MYVYVNVNGNTHNPFRRMYLNRRALSSAILDHIMKVTFMTSAKRTQNSHHNVCAYIHTYVHIHTYIHIYTHTQRNFDLILTGFSFFSFKTHCKDPSHCHSTYVHNRIHTRVVRLAAHHFSACVRSPFLTQRVRYLLTAIVLPNGMYVCALENVCFREDITYLLTY